jgi:Phosphoribosyl transferase/TRSP domain C terminus to PRTase_2
VSGRLGPPRIAAGPPEADSSVAAADLAADWLWDSLGLRIQVDADVYGRGLHGLVGLALRRNPRRAHLLVSRVLGKHLPVPPATALAAGTLLARQVRLAGGGLDAAGGVGTGMIESGVAGTGVAGARPLGAGPLVLGYCETATALGHAVADALPGSYYLHTTRRSVPGMRPLLAFTESHSHATHHWVIPADAELVRAPRPLVLVDDELSTGNTALGTIRTLHAFAPRPSYTVAALLDARPEVARAAFEALADDLGVPVDVVSLVSATVRVPPDVARRAQRVRERFGAGGAEAADRTDQSGAGGETAGGVAGRRAGPGDAGHRVVHLAPDWPRELPDGGRHGWPPSTRALLDAVLPGVAAGIAARLTHPGRRTLVLGTEELMYTPMRLAAALAERTGGDVLYQSTTRSPVYPLDVPGYAIRSALTFPAPDDPARTSSVYNVRPGRYDDIVVVADSGADAASPSGATTAQVAGMVAELRRCAPVTVVTLPAYFPAVVR